MAHKDPSPHMNDYKNVVDPKQQKLQSLRIPYGFPYRIPAELRTFERSLKDCFKMERLMRC